MLFEPAVRAVYEVPRGRGFTVGDITINGTPIQFGAQIADFVTIKVIGLACGFGRHVVPPATECEGAVRAVVPSVEAAVQRTFVRRQR